MKSLKGSKAKEILSPNQTGHKGPSWAQQEAKVSPFLAQDAEVHRKTKLGANPAVGWC